MEEARKLIHDKPELVRQYPGNAPYRRGIFGRYRRAWPRNIGPKAASSVMEGKCRLFTSSIGLYAVPIVRAVRDKAALTASFIGGNRLELDSSIPQSLAPRVARPYPPPRRRPRAGAGHP